MSRIRPGTNSASASDLQKSPFTLLRRLDCVLEPSKGKVLAAAKEKAKAGALALDRALIKGADFKNIVQGNTLSHDGMPDKKFDYLITNAVTGKINVEGLVKILETYGETRRARRNKIEEWKYSYNRKIACKPLFRHYINEFLHSTLE